MPPAPPRELLSSLQRTAKFQTKLLTGMLEAHGRQQVSALPAAATNHVGPTIEIKRVPLVKQCKSELCNVQVVCLTSTMLPCCSYEKPQAGSSEAGDAAAAPQAEQKPEKPLAPRRTPVGSMPDAVGAVPDAKKPVEQTLQVFPSASCCNSSLMCCSASAIVRLAARYPVCNTSLGVCSLS